MTDQISHQLVESLHAVRSMDITPIEKIQLYYKLLNAITEEATYDEPITFNTLFSRMSFLQQKFDISKRDAFLAHFFRVNVEKKKINSKTEGPLSELAFLILERWLAYISKTKLAAFLDLPQEIENILPEKDTRLKNNLRIIEACVIEINTIDKTLTYLFDDAPGQTLIAKYDLPDRNESFTKSLEAITRVFSLPVHINFYNTAFDEDNIAYPKAFVIHPDFLLDVTSIASYSSDNNHDKWLYGLNRFIPKKSNDKLLLGNVVNHILDVLVSKPETPFKDLAFDIFKLYPLEWSLYTDNEVLDLYEKILFHYNRLVSVLHNDLLKKDIKLQNIYIEPAFYSRDFGIQGRLDLFHIDQSGQNRSIIELKSAAPFKPNSYGISNSHYLQTMLYDMIIESAFGAEVKAKNYILYSKLPENNLKFAPSSTHQREELLLMRNELVAIDSALGISPTMATKIIEFLQSAHFPGIKGFHKTNLEMFENVYQTSTQLEQTYFAHFTAFISREMQLSKVGEHGLNKSNGLAALWLDSIEEKEDRFGILNHLRLIQNHASEDDPLLLFKKTDFTADLTNFREGDIAVLYPHDSNPRHVLRHQIFKCTILKMDHEDVKVRLRSPQFNNEIFIQNDFWNIEADNLTSSFNHMFRSLFEFISADSYKKDTILGLKRPENYEQAIDITLDDELTSEQKAIVRKAYLTKDYYLIWGPPGSGKTSMVLKHLTKTLIKYSNEKILLLAYTNRAVDEMCGALRDGGFSEKYIRIGSRYSVGEAFISDLLEQKIKKTTHRKEIIECLHQHRIYVSTVASIQGKSELFNLVSFHTVIIDEASQILEPNLVGLLTKFEKFILIGDHKQLPAVVTQNERYTKIEDDALISLGISDMRTSLFERLYTQCLRNKWNNAWDILSHQGRMHVEIMNFVNTSFYENKLKPIEKLKRLVAPRELQPPSKAYHDLCQNRMIFINTPLDTDFNWKTNEFEADAVAEIVSQLLEVFTFNNIKILPTSIGVIAPYRSQISLINMKIAHHNLPITVDTVERYQGGARDIIVISLCTNKISQLKTLVSLSNDGVDRKLNVALTRAKEQVIIIGNEDILSVNETYANLISACFKLKL